MSGHVSTVAAIYEAFGRGDIPYILGQLADDVRWEHWTDNRAQHAGVPWMQPRTGRTEVPGFFAEVGRWQFHAFNVVSIAGNDSRVFAEVQLEATVNGQRMHEEEVHLWELDAGGRVTRFRHYLDTAKHIVLAAGRASAGA